MAVETEDRYQLITIPTVLANPEFFPTSGHGAVTVAVVWNLSTNVKGADNGKQKCLQQETG